MKILTISTLYHKGGAAYIAKTLHESMLEEGIASKYFVGYAQNGLPLKKEKYGVEFANYSIPFSTHLNYISHSLLGIDFFSPRKQQLLELIEWSDVIICHTLHSYFLNYKYLFNLIKKGKTEKNIIMVAHDSWHYTGRCAFVFNCEDWKSGCVTCRNKKYYPPTIISNSEKEYKRKIEAFNNIPNLTFVSPAEWICKDLKEVYQKKNVYTIRNAIDTSPFESVERKFRNTNELEICVSSVDISQPGKINLPLIKELLDKGVKVHFIGKNNPYEEHPNAINHGFISDRSKYVEILNNIDCYLFSSIIDIYPTVLVDALCAGNFIFYTPSKGANEIMEGENQWPGKSVNSSDDIINFSKSKTYKSLIIDQEIRNLHKEKALNFYHKKRMFNDYMNLINKELENCFKKI